MKYLDHQLAHHFQGLDVKLIDSILYSWGASRRSDRSEINKMLGVSSIFGFIMRSKRQENQSTATFHKSHYYPEAVYTKIDGIRKTLSESERNILDCRYRYRLSIRKIMKKNKCGPDVYYSAIRKIQREMVTNFNLDHIFEY